MTLSGLNRLEAVISGWWLVARGRGTRRCEKSGNENRRMQWRRFSHSKAGTKGQGRGSNGRILALSGRNVDFQEIYC
jgi:hypothetical protein